MRNIFKKKSNDKKVLDDKKPETIDTKSTEGIDNGIKADTITIDEALNVGDDSKNAVDPNENANQQKELNKLLRKPKLSYGEILEARRQTKKANTLAGGNKKVEGE